MQGITIKTKVPHRSQVVPSLIDTITNGLQYDVHSVSITKQMHQEKHKSTNIIEVLAKAF